MYIELLILFRIYIKLSYFEMSCVMFVAAMQQSMLCVYLHVPLGLDVLVFINII